jgi:hypothetical protein
VYNVSGLLAAAELGSRSHEHIRQAAAMSKLRMWPIKRRVKEKKETKEMSSQSGAPTAKSATATVPASPAAAAPSERQPAAIKYVDRDDMGETFADSIIGLRFDGQTLRIEFGVTRFDEIKANAPITGRRYPACRLVLPPAAAVDLINRIQQIAAALTQAGIVVKTAPRATEASEAV